MNATKTYSIKINGGGTTVEIIKALEYVIEGIKVTEDLSSVEWEDPTLITEISEDEE